MFESVAFVFAVFACIAVAFIGYTPARVMSRALKKKAQEFELEQEVEALKNRKVLREKLLSGEIITNDELLDLVEKIDRQGV